MRILRLIWVSLANGAAIYLFYSGARQIAVLNHLLEQDSKNTQVWLWFGFEAVVPVGGIVLEAFEFRFAKWLNISFFTVVGGWLLTVGLLNRSDYHAAPYLLFGACGLLIAGVTYLLDRPCLRAQLPT